MSFFPVFCLYAKQWEPANGCSLVRWAKTWGWHWSFHLNLGKKTNCIFPKLSKYFFKVVTSITLPLCWAPIFALSQSRILSGVWMTLFHKIHCTVKRPINSFKKKVLLCGVSIETREWKFSFCLRVRVRQQLQMSKLCHEALVWQELISRSLCDAIILMSESKTLACPTCYFPVFIFF